MKQYEFMPGTRVRYHGREGKFDLTVMSNLSTREKTEYRLKLVKVGSNKTKQTLKEGSVITLRRFFFERPSGFLLKRNRS